MQLWNILKTDVNMTKRQNKILSAFAVLVVATVAWIYILPAIDPSGVWIGTDSKAGVTAYIAVHENVSSHGYTVLELTYTPTTEGKLKENLDTQGKANLVTAWAWRLRTLQRYPQVEPVPQGMTLDELRHRATDVCHT